MLVVMAKKPIPDGDAEEVAASIDDLSWEREWALFLLLSGLSCLVMLLTYLTIRGQVDVALVDGAEFWTLTPDAAQIVGSLALWSACLFLVAAGACLGSRILQIRSRWMALGLGPIGVVAGLTLGGVLSHPAIGSRGRLHVQDRVFANLGVPTDPGVVQHLEDVELALVERVSLGPWHEGWQVLAVYKAFRGSTRIEAKLDPAVGWFGGQMGVAGDRYLILTNAATTGLVFDLATNKTIRGPTQLSALSRRLTNLAQTPQSEGDR